MVNPFFFHHKADMRVNNKKANMSTVAIHLVGANILLIWFTGPIKKHVLAKATILPNVYSNAKGAEKKNNNILKTICGNSTIVEFFFQK